MAKLKTLKIDDVEDNRDPSKIKIVVMPHGWVMVGELNGDRLTHCKNVRRWGTSNGLGELAENGPTSSTKLDKYPPCDVAARLFTIDVNEDKWS